MAVRFALAPVSVPENRMSLVPPITSTRHWLRAYCRGSGSLTVDFAADFYRPDGQLCQEMLWDGLHPSEDGHSKMAERLARLLLRKG